MQTSGVTQRFVYKASKGRRGRLFTLQLSRRVSRPERSLHPFAIHGRRIRSKLKSKRVKSTGANRIFVESQLVAVWWFYPKIVTGPHHMANFRKDGGLFYLDRDGKLYHGTAPILAVWTSTLLHSGCGNRTTILSACAKIS